MDAGPNMIINSMSNIAKASHHGTAGWKRKTQRWEEEEKIRKKIRKWRKKNEEMEADNKWTARSGVLPISGGEEPHFYPPTPASGGEAAPIPPHVPANPVPANPIPEAAHIGATGITHQLETLSITVEKTFLLTAASTACCHCSVLPDDDDFTYTKGPAPSEPTIDLHLVTQ
ncbi:hypothetical protein Tco_0726843 [Tanacetum coccineum]|uniref:Uncharacterized protein n=1 Tax=Tanacetum coccineum TaxID=301880 RepID=A0ABQ4YJ91_9ASTR